MPAQATLTHPFTLEGIGLHTGAPARVTVRPSRSGGRVFLRQGAVIPALTDFVVETRRCTTLGRDGVTVSTVEHLLAALWLADLDHAEIEVDGPEMPALDGSAAAWMAAVCDAGRMELDTPAEVWSITAPAWVQDGDSQFMLTPAAELALYAAIAVPETIAETMIAGGDAADDRVLAQIVRARTYALEAEVRALLDAGLARGGSLDNAVVLTRDGYLNAHVWPDEPAWHKVLDLAGDLALTGVRLRGQVLALRAGHRSHVGLAAQLRLAWRTACQPSENGLP